MSQRVVSGFSQGEKTTDWTTIMTRRHSVNIVAI